MRKQIAAANWKMNLTQPEAEALTTEIVNTLPALEQQQEVLLAVPFVYLQNCQQQIQHKKNVYIAAQNMYSKLNGAYTGEISATMLQSIQINTVILGHSERRTLFNETNQMLKDKILTAVNNHFRVIFCCGEPLSIREKGEEANYVLDQLEAALFALDATQIKQIVIAYEPIWAIGTGKTASTQQAQAMHAFIRNSLEQQYNASLANNLSILYGGSVKASNAQELFSQPDIDGGLVGGASLVAKEFVEITRALK